MKKTPVWLARFTPMSTAGTLCALAALSCGSVGERAPAPGLLPHGGVGPFRDLSADETGIVGPPDGLARALTPDALDGVALTEAGDLYYAGAPLAAAPTPRPADLPETDVHWGAFAARRIYRAVGDESPSFQAGSVVLMAEAPWEGEALEDPCPLSMPDGRTRLYYAAAGGIGLAEDAGSGFSRVSAGPLLGRVFEGTAREGVPGEPSVVVGPGPAYWLYFSVGAEIGVARSEDGLSFTDVRRLDLSGPDETTSPEVAVASPGAVALTTRAGQRIVRLYFESVRADGSHLIYLAASDNGVDFERSVLPVDAALDKRSPAPRQVDERVTLLYATAPAIGAGRQVRGLVASVAPSVEMLPALR